MKNSIIIRQSIFINKPKSVVWNYTQNYSYRPAWDRSVLSATVLHTSPNRMVRLKLKGNTAMTFVYKLDDRPNKTSLKAIDIDSPYIKSAGGSWTYEEQDGITKWTRVDTIVLKNSLVMSLSIWFLKLILNFQSWKAMKKVKCVLENVEFDSK